MEKPLKKVEIPLKVEDITIPWFEDLLKKYGYSSADPDYKVTTFGYENSKVPMQMLFGNIHHIITNIKRTSPEGEDKVESLGLLLKMRPLAPLPRELTDDLNTFQRELLIYERFLPSIEKEMGVKVSPTFLLGHKEGESFLILTRDVTQEGFKLKNSQKQMSLQDYEDFVKFLASYHAAGHILDLEEPPATYLEPLGKKLKCRGEFSEAMRKWTSQLTKVLREMFCQNPAIEHLHSTCCLDPEQSLFHSYDSCNPAFLTYIQGDTSTNNILYKSQTDAPTEWRFLNWHLTRRSIGPLEFLYFMYGNTDTEFRCKYMSLLEELYYRKYIRCLQDYDEGILNNCNYSFDKFECECRKLPSFCLSVAIQLTVWRQYPDKGVFTSLIDGQPFDKSLYRKIMAILKEIGPETAEDNELETSPITNTSASLPTP